MVSKVAVDLHRTDRTAEDITSHTKSLGCDDIAVSSSTLESGEVLLLVSVHCS